MKRYIGWSISIVLMVVFIPIRLMDSPPSYSSQAVANMLKSKI